MPSDRPNRTPTRDLTAEQKKAKRARWKANRRRAREVAQQVERLVRRSLADFGAPFIISPPHVQSDAELARDQLTASRGGITRYRQVEVAKALYEALSQGRGSEEEFKAAARFLGLRPNHSLGEVEALLRDILQRGEKERPEGRLLRRRAFRGPRPPKLSP